MGMAAILVINKLSFPLSIEAQHKIWLWLAIGLKIADNEGQRRHRYTKSLPLRLRLW